MLISSLYRRTHRNFPAAFISAGIGNLVILLCGALWLSVLTQVSASAAVKLAILPFLPGDALKVAAAAALAAGFQRLHRQNA